MTNYSDIEISHALNVLGSLDEGDLFEQICKINEPQRNKYKELLDKFDSINKVSSNTPGAPKNLRNLKGAALEELVKYLLQISGKIFNVSCNLRTSTNEIDELITLTSKGKLLVSRNMIDKRFEKFLGECKNYNKRVGVTYVGKFCSLLLTNNIKLGIIFSYHGVSGRGWNNGAGLIKKFYLHKEKLEERFCIIDFSYKEFESIYYGKNFLQIVEEQLCSLQFDTDYSRYVSTHPAE